MINATSTMSKVEETVTSIANAALAVRKELGTNLINEVYEWCLFHEFEQRGLSYKTHVAMPITYESIKVEKAYIIDILVEDCVIVKVKPVCSNPELYKSHVQTYMKHSEYPAGVLLDFDAKLKKNCMNRIAL